MRTHHRPNYFPGSLAILSCVVLLSACSTGRVAERTAPAHSVVAAPAPPADLAGTAEVPADVAGTAPSLDTSPNGSPACECADAKPRSRPKLRPKRLTVHQEPPAPLKSDSAPAEPSATGVVDADLQLLNSAVESVLGRKVQGLKGEDFGRVVDVLTDGSGKVRVAIIDFGGFLGVGNRRLAVDWSLLRADPEHQDNALLLRLSTEKLQSAPVYKESSHPQVLMVP